MKKIGSSILFFMLATCVCACDDGGSDSQSDDSTKPVFSLTQTIENVGAIPNQVVLHGDDAYIVSSGDNVIQKLALETLTLQKNYIDLGENANPYAMAVDEDDIYIACSMSNQIIKTSTADPTVLTTVMTQTDGIDGPTDILVSPDYIYVTNSEYDMTTYEPGGSVVVKSKTENQIAMNETAYRNPTAIYNFNLKNFQGIVTVFTGQYLFDANYNIIGVSKSAVGMGASFDHASDSASMFDAVLLEDKDVGKMAPLSGGRVFVVGTASSSTFHLIAYDARADASQRYSLLSLSLEGDVAMIQPLAIDEERVVLANFNDDSLYLLDVSEENMRHCLDGDEAACDVAQTKLRATKFALSKSSVDKRGPISMAWDAKRKQLLVLNNLSETLDVIRID